MSTANRPNRKATDDDIIKLNSVGMSLSSIAKELDVHPSTVTLRLQQLNVPPADTRRTFMEDIYKSLSSDQQDWLAAQLGPGISIKDYVRNLLLKEYISVQPS
jgi:transposase